MAGPDLPGYRIVSVLGRGGMGVVYLAEDANLGRKVAIKVLAPELADDPDLRARFVRESKMAAAIDHPNIVPIYEARDHGGQTFVVMRYVPGSDLGAILRQSRRLDLPRVSNIAQQLANALDAAHAEGLVHRDVKPGNVLVVPSTHPGRSDHIYLGDFGLTKRFGGSEGLTRSGQVVGTVDYMAPEQIHGRAVSPATDEYSLACVVYQCLTGLHPYERETDTAVLLAHLSDTPPPLSQIRPDLPAGLDAVISKAMAKDPEDRYETCGDFAEAFEVAAKAPQRKLATATAATMPVIPAAPPPPEQGAPSASPFPSAPPPPPPEVAGWGAYETRGPAAPGVGRATRAEPVGRGRRGGSGVALIAGLLVGAVVVAGLGIYGLPLLASPGAAGPSGTLSAAGAASGTPARDPSKTSATRTAEPEPEATRTPPATARPPSTSPPQATRRPAPDPTATPPHVRLFGQIPEAIRPTCTRDVNSGSLESRGAIARYVCRPDSLLVDSVAYSLHASRTAMYEAHTALRLDRGIEADSGDCDGGVEGEHAYSGGRVLCFSAPGSAPEFQDDLFASVRLNSDAANISVGLLGDDNDISELYRWGLTRALPRS